MTELATAYISIVAETSSIPGSIRRALGQADGEGRRAGQSAGRSFGTAFSSSVKGLVGALGVAGGIATIGAGIKSAMTSGMDFTNALNTMQAVAGASTAQVAKVGEVARQLGTDNQLAATSSVDAAQAMLELAKGGFTVEQSMSAARGTLQLAAAAQIEAAEAATIQSQALQAFGLQADQAGRVADVLANAANASSAEITDVAYALAQGGTVAKQFGMSVEDAATTIGLLANAGIQGSDAGTLMKSALLALTEPTEKQTFAMEQLGLWTEGVGFQFKGMGDLFAKLGAASKTMTRDQYNSATAVLFGSDAMRLAGVAATQGAAGWDKMRAAMGQSGSAAAVAAAKMQGLPGAWEKLKNAAQDAGLAFYDAVEGPLTSAANKASEVIGDLVTKAQDAGGDLGTALANPELQARLDRLFGDTKETFTGLGSAAAGLVPSLAEIASSLAMASAAVGVGTWQILLTVLQAGTTVLNALNPLLSATANLMQSNQAAVTALLGAWVLFKTIPAIMGRATATLAPMAAGMRTTTTSVRGLVAANTALSQGAATSLAGMRRLAGVVQTASGGFTTLTGRTLTAAQAQQRMAAAAASGMLNMGRFGSAIQQMGQRVPLIAQMQSSFVNAASGANRFGRTAGVAAAAGTGLRAAGAGIAGVFGGPVGLALTGAVIAGTAWASTVAQQKQITEQYTSSLVELAKAQQETGLQLIASRGAVNDSVYQSVTAQVESLTQALDSAAKNDARWTDVTKDVVANIFTFGQANEDTSQKLDAAAAKADATRKAISDLGLTNGEVARIVAGDSGKFATMESELRQMGEGGRAAADHLSGMRVEFLRQRDIATRMVPGITELSAAIDTMGDDSASASDKMTALKAAMDAMSPARTKAEALAQFGDSIRKAAEVQGIDSTAFSGGQFDAMSESGAALSRTLGDLATKANQVASSTNDATKRARLMAEVNKQIEQVFRQLADATGQPIERIRQLYSELGGGAVELTVKLAGESDVVQQMGAVKAAFDAQPDKKTISFTSDQITEQTEATLTRLGYTVERIPGTREVRVTVNGDAQAQLGALIAQIAQVPGGKAIQTTAPGGQGVLAMLQAMGAQVRVDNNKNIVVDAPLAQGVSDQLAQIGIQVRTDNGKTVLVKADDTDFQARRQDWTKTEQKTIQVRAAVESYNQSLSGLGFGQNRLQVGPDGKPHLAPRADGALVAYADGGIRDLEAYANGAGLRTMAKPTRADIYAGRGAGTIFAEEETGGEAYIPLAQGKRGRSTDILAAVASMFGFDLLPQGVLPDTLSGLVGGVAGGALSKLLKATGIDGVRRFADGGFTTGAALRALAEGRGASRPLTGAPYVRGGVNWGDCCLVAETPVWGPDGATPIAELSPGQRVWSYVDGKLESHQVTAAWFSKTQQTFTVRAGSATVVGSDNHPFLRYAGNDVEWARLDELRVGDRLVVLDDTDFVSVAIDTIEAHAIVDTYDIEVEGSHNFIAGGVVVHNSGAMSAFARAAAGLDPFGDRFATANEGEYLAKLGAKSGLKGGAMQFGWVNGGPGGGHTAGTLPDGTNVEMGGGNGGGMLGGSVGANDPQFTNHAYIDVKDEDRYSGGGTDSPTGTGAQQNNPDAAYGGGYTFDPISNDATTGSGDSSISGRLGGVASAFITGQLSSLFEILSVNDQPGWLAAILEYEKQHSEDAKKNYDAEKKKLDEDFKAAEDQRKADYDAAKSAIDQDYQSQLISSAERDNRLLALKNGYETDELGHRHDYENSVIRLGQKYGQVDQDSVGSLSLKQRYENEQLKRSQGLQGDQYAREARFNREKRSLDNLRDAKSISQDEYQRRLGALRAQYDADVRGMRTRYNQDDAAAKSNFERSQSIYAPKDRYNPSTVTTEQYHPSDPGTNSSGRTGDPDSSRTGRVTSTGNQIKDAFKSGLREAWRDGQPWTDTDWIITKESNWNPTAVNPSSGAFGLPQFLGATKDKYLPDSSPDPKVQGTAYDHYVGDRYQTPMGARAHWEANNWYDQGGVGIGTGLMAKNVIPPERVLSPRQTASFEEMVKRDFQSGIGTDRVATLLEQILAALRAGPRGNATYNVGDDRGLRRAEKIEERRHKSAMAGF